MNLTATYLGLKLASPFMLGASPLTGHLDNARRLEDNGCAAIVMHSLFEEQIPAAVSTRIAEAARSASGFGHFPRSETLPLGRDAYLEQLRRIKAAVSIPVIGSLNGLGPDGWTASAPLIEEAGADALEVNLYYVATSADDAAADIESAIEGLVPDLKRLIRIPVALKLSPFYTAFANLASRLDRAGADGLVLFNRFYQPDVDVETMEVLPNLRLSTSAELLLRLRWLAILYERIRPSLAASGGVHTALDGIKALVSGAHAVQLVSAILQQGPQHFRVMTDGLRHWMTQRGYASIEEARGRLSLARSTDPTHFERASYIRVLQSWGG
jgi:dihydroorotate dehydrogenase (fumarate)